MRTYAVFLPNPAIVNITKFEDLIPTGKTIKLSGSYTPPQVVNQLKAISVLDAQANVSYTVQIADTLTSIYVWKNINQILPGAGGPSNAAFNGTPGGSTISPSIGSNISPNGNVGQGQITPKNKQFPVGSTPWQQPEMLAILILEERISSFPLLNQNGPYFTTQKVIRGATGNGDPGSGDFLNTPIIYPDTEQQLQNIKDGHPEKNANTLADGSPLPGYGQGNPKGK